MTAVVEKWAGTVPPAARARGGLTAEIHRGLASVEPVWRAMETGAGALLTPYQRFDWVRAYVESGIDAARARGGDVLRIVVVRDAAGQARALLPLRVERKLSLRIARVIGDRHANFHMPLFASREAPGLAPEELCEALVRAGPRAGIDVYALDHQPRVWDGLPNPLSARAHACPSDAYGLRLGPDAETTLRRAFSGDARKKLRAKERKLVEMLGPIEHRVASTPSEVSEIVAAFYAQKAARLAGMGVADPYADPAVRRFVAHASDPGDGRAAIEVHALVATASGRILATFGGAADAERFSGMWTSFDPDPDVGRFSPGDLLLSRLIGQQSGLRRGFDLGVGEARYKVNVCDETIALAEAVVPATLRGRGYALARRGSRWLKRRIKRSPRLFSALKRLRRAALAAPGIKRGPRSP